MFAVGPDYLGRSWVNGFVQAASSCAERMTSEAGTEPDKIPLPWLRLAMRAAQNCIAPGCINPLLNGTSDLSRPIRSRGAGRARGGAHRCRIPAALRQVGVNSLIGRACGGIAQWGPALASSAVSRESV